MSHLPPDLSRLGDELCTAAEQVLERRRRRREFMARVAAVGAAGALLFAALTPASLTPSEPVRVLTAAPVGTADATFASATVTVPPECELPAQNGLGQGCVPTGFWGGLGAGSGPK